MLGLELLSNFNRDKMVSCQFSMDMNVMTVWELGQTMFDKHCVSPERFSDLERMIFSFSPA